MPGRTPVRTALTALAVSMTATAVLGACGVGPHRTLDTRSIESEIAAGMARQYGFPSRLISVTCPGAIPEVVSQMFICRARLDGQDLAIDGTVTSSRGRYSIQPASAVIVAKTLEAELQSRITTQLHARATVRCGAKTVLIATPSSSFFCQAMVQGHPRLVTVTVVDLKGNVRLSVAPPAAGGG